MACYVRHTLIKANNMPERRHYWVLGVVFFLGTCHRLLRPCQSEVMCLVASDKSIPRAQPVYENESDLYRGAEPDVDEFEFGSLENARAVGVVGVTDSRLHARWQRLLCRLSFVRQI